MVIVVPVILTIIARPAGSAGEPVAQVALWIWMVSTGASRKLVGPMK
jgi:hypothetical protein